MLNSRQRLPVIIWLHVFPCLVLCHPHDQLSGPCDYNIIAPTPLTVECYHTDATAHQGLSTSLHANRLRHKRFIEKPFIDLQQSWKTRELHIPGFLTIPDDVCPDKGSNIDVLMFVISPYSNYKHRAASRATWKNFLYNNQQAKLLYLIDTPSSYDEKLDIEMEYFDDIVQTANLNGRYDSSLMAQSMLEFVTTYCSRVHFVARIDDHMFVNVPELLSVIDENRDQKQALFGMLRKYKPESTDSGDLHYIADCLTPYSVFPDYLSKPLYVIPNALVKKLRCYSMASVHLPADDVYLTGVIAEKSNTKKVSIPNLFTDSNNVTVDDLKTYAAIRTTENVILQQRTLWRQFLNPTPPEYLEMDK